MREDGAHIHLSVARLMAKGDGVTAIQRQPQIKVGKGVIKLFCLLHALLCFKQNFLSGHTAMHVKKLLHEGSGKELGMRYHSQTGLHSALTALHYPTLTSSPFAEVPAADHAGYHTSHSSDCSPVL